MKQLLIKLGLWEKPKSFEDQKYGNQVPPGFTLVDVDWLQVAMKHYCGACERWFKEARGAGAHQRIVHEGLFKKDRSKDA